MARLSFPARLCVVLSLFVAADSGRAQTAAPTPTPASYPGGEGTPLGVQIAALLSDPAVSEAHWGIAVTAMDGTPIYGRDEGGLFRPASTAKLFTTAAAMAMLGPQHTVATTVYGHLSDDKGTVEGDLFLVGAGDPSFGTDDLPYQPTAAAKATAAGLTFLVEQLQAKGIHAITGNVIGDDRLFGSEGPPEGWEYEDLIQGYGTLPNALSIGNDELAVTIGPADLNVPAPSDTPPATVKVEQTAPLFQVENASRTVSAGAVPADTISITRSPLYPWTLRVAGALAADSAPRTVHLALGDPARYAAATFELLLKGSGIRVQGEHNALYAPVGTPSNYLRSWREEDTCHPGPQDNWHCDLPCPPPLDRGELLAVSVSPKLAEEVVFTLKTSANLHAEMLLRQLGLLNACPGASAVMGARLIREWLVNAGLRQNDFVFYDGSGLSVKDLVTPRAEAQLLAYATTQPWFAPWQAALPVGGVDGTLADRFTEPPLKGNVFAKTGTLGESRALAGFVRCASGREVIFSILDDDHEPGSSADRAVMDRIVAAIAANK